MPIKLFRYNNIYMGIAQLRIACNLVFGGIFNVLLMILKSLSMDICNFFVNPF